MCRSSSSMATFCRTQIRFFIPSRPHSRINGRALCLCFPSAHVPIVVVGPPSLLPHITPTEYAYIAQEVDLSLPVSLSDRHLLRFRLIAHIPSGEGGGWRWKRLQKGCRHESSSRALIDKRTESPGPSFSSHLPSPEVVSCEERLHMSHMRSTCFYMSLQSFKSRFLKVAPARSKRKKLNILIALGRWVGIRYLFKSTLSSSSSGIIDVNRVAVQGI